MKQLDKYFKEIQKAKKALVSLGDKAKQDFLFDLAKSLILNKQRIIDSNKIDLDNGVKNSLSSALMDRLMLDSERIESMAQGVKQTAILKNPVNRIIEGWDLPNGLRVQKVSIPIGVVGVIYESRPNVTSDVAVLCFKSSNVAILKGGKEAKHSNDIIISIIQETLIKHNLPKYCVSSFVDDSREGVRLMITQDKHIDLIVPRGGSGLIEFVNQNSSVPVVKHDKGVCHVFVDEFANIKKAIDIVINAKTRRVGVCNAMECMLVHKNISKEFLPIAKKEFDKHSTLLKGCSTTRDIIDISECKQEDYFVEYLDNILNIKVVDSLDDAISHITNFGSGHSDAIVTENYTNANEFSDKVDSACVYVNASTAFTDGGEFGFGAEVGISTNKLHARGPMGINELTTYKFKVLGNGQIR